MNKNRILKPKQKKKFDFVIGQPLLILLKSILKLILLIYRFLYLPLMQRITISNPTKKKLKQRPELTNYLKKKIVSQYILNLT